MKALSSADPIHPSAIPEARNLMENLRLLFPPLDLFHSLSRAISLIYGAQRIGSDSYTVAKIVMWKCCVISVQLQLEDHAT